MIDAYFHSQRVSQIKAVRSEAQTTRGSGQATVPPSRRAGRRRHEKPEPLGQLQVSGNVAAPGALAPVDASAHACSESLLVHGFPYSKVLVPAACQAKCPTAKGSDRQVACANGHRQHTCLSPFGGLCGQRWEAQDASTNRFERLLHWVSEADWRVPWES